MRLVFLIVIVISSAANAELQDMGLDIIPKPAAMEWRGGSCALNGLVRVYAEPAEELRDTAELLARQLTADRVPAVVGAQDADPTSPSILLTLEDSDPALGAEGYELSIAPRQVVIRATQPAGLFYGTQTLRQVIATASSGDGDELVIPCLEIRDQPRFAWRGLLLDCSRTFLQPAYLKRYVDLLAYYRMNVLHLHLTDHQGWRIAIDKHPKLTEVGSKYHPFFNNDNEVNGYYSKEEIRDLIRYAEARHVRVVPEIEMPTHSNAILYAYPEVACRSDETYSIVPNQYKKTPSPELPVPPRGMLCAGNERTFEVLEDVLAEVIDLFPSPYIHIGGDEGRMEYWRNCPKCQARIEEEGLGDEYGLQSYFIKRIEKVVNAQGRAIIGWGEILKGGLAPNAVVMSWRGTEAGVAAAQEGHDVVMTPKTHCYFDYGHDRISVRQTYAFEPIPSELSPDQSRHILGAQGCMWTHKARTEAAIDRMILPRLIALAEVTWSPKDLRDERDFENRLSRHYPLLEAMGLDYKH